MEDLGCPNDEREEEGAPDYRTPSDVPHPEAANHFWGLRAAEEGLGAQGRSFISTTHNNGAHPRLQWLLPPVDGSATSSRPTSSAASLFIPMGAVTHFSDFQACYIQPTLLIKVSIRIGLARKTPSLSPLRVKFTSISLEEVWWRLLL